MPARFETRLSAILTEIEETEVLELARDIQVPAGHELYFEDESVAHIYLLTEGQLTLERITSNGEKQILAFVFPGDLIGLDLGGRHISGAMTLTDCTLKAIKRQTLDQLLDARHALSRALTDQTRKIVAYMLDHICALGRMTARQRVAFFLIHMHGRYKSAGFSVAPMHLMITRQDIADFLGIRVETAIRQLSLLAREGLIKIEHDTQVTLLDYDALTAELP